MDYLSKNVAANLKRIRKSKCMSLDQAAEQTGVSKSMLAQVERGEGNPTLSTLWKLSNGMKVPFNALTVSPKAPYEVVRTAEMQPILEDGGKVKNYCLFPDDENRKFSVYYMELAPGSHWKSEPHLRGTTEFVTLFAGAIEITADQKDIVVQAGESVRFQGDTTHAYRNISDQTTILHMILYNP